MNFARTLGSLLLLAAFGTHANAQLTREHVKAELAEAIRTGVASRLLAGAPLSAFAPNRECGASMMAKRRILQAAQRIAR
jgi:hypothetical protein